MNIKSITMKRKVIARIIIAFIYVVSASLVHAHETWIRPSDYQVEKGVPIALDIRNGQDFEGVSLPWLDGWFHRFTANEGKIERPLTGRNGDLPAATIRPMRDGLMIIALETKPDILVYEEWQKFKLFVTEKGYPEAIQQHIDRGLPHSNFSESFTRHIKTLIAIGDGQGSDRSLGLKHEFILHNNPYQLGDNNEIQAELRFDNQPRIGALVTIFSYDQNAAMQEVQYRTDENGLISFRLRPNTEYLLDSVWLSPAPRGSLNAWRTNWAALSFKTPPK